VAKAFLDLALDGGLEPDAQADVAAAV
jgi:hypothetical protein